MTRQLKDPSSVLIEVVAGTLCATWYEIGRSQGLKSKYKTTKAYVNANVEKFIPKAIEHLIDQLNNPFISHENKELIYDALSDRVNDPSNITSSDIRGLPSIYVMKVLNATNVAPPSQQLKKVRDKPTIINTTTIVGKSGIGQSEINKRLKTGTAIGAVK